jgi:excisionase family DNA binding protein
VAPTAKNPARPHRTETIKQAAERHRCHPRTIRRRIAAGELKAYKFGPAMLRVDPDEVDALLRPLPTVQSA